MSGKFLPLLVALFFLAGCGYTPLRKDGAPFDERSIQVATFANSSHYPEVEGRLRQALSKELAFLPITLGEDGADLLLDGDVESLNLESVSFSGQDKVLIYRIQLTVLARVIEGKSGKVIWKAREIVREEYPANSDMALQRNARDWAVSEACREMAHHLVLQMRRFF